MPFHWFLIKKYVYTRIHTICSKHKGVGKHKGAGTLLKEKAPWIQGIHCFNTRIELALKDAFRTTSFEELDSMLSKFYYLYQKSPKRLSELRDLSKQSST